MKGVKVYILSISVLVILEKLKHIYYVCGTEKRSTIFDQLYNCTHYKN